MCHIQLCPYYTFFRSLSSSNQPVHGSVQVLDETTYMTGLSFIMRLLVFPGHLYVTQYTFYAITMSLSPMHLCE